VGLLRDAESGELRALAARSLVGRTALCAVRIADPRVSSEHAVVAWRDDRWWVRDLGSRNGTFLDGRRLDPGEEAPIPPGGALRFGERAWTLDDDAAPAPVAVDLVTGAIVTAPGDVLLLPDGLGPTLSVGPTATGGWRAESDTERWDVADLDTVSAGPQRFRLYLPTSSDPTVGPDRPVELAFRVSPDEEQVDVEVSCGARVARFGRRSHHYLLLTLARIRLAQPNRSSAERGWVQRDELAHMLRVDRATVNVQVHRIRQELGQHRLDGAERVVEVRTRTGQIRVGTDRIIIR
jgi:FHA domain